jgi:hypothetical protein
MDSLVPLAELGSSVFRGIIGCFACTGSPVAAQYATEREYCAKPGAAPAFWQAFRPRRQRLSEMQWANAHETPPPGIRMCTEAQEPAHDPRWRKRVHCEIAALFGLGVRNRQEKRRTVCDAEHLAASRFVASSRVNKWQFLVCIEKQTLVEEVVHAQLESGSCECLALAIFACPVARRLYGTQWPRHTTTTTTTATCTHGRYTMESSICFAITSQRLRRV